MHCAEHAWVPYDTSISPLDNMYSKPTDLDPQPEYSLRTEFVYYQEEAETAADALVGIESARQEGPIVPASNAPSTMTLFVLWCFGLIVWCMLFVNHGGGGGKGLRKRHKGGGSKDV